MGSEELEHVLRAGLALYRHQRDASAELCFRQVYGARPDLRVGRAWLAACLLRQGRLAEGWPHFEARDSLWAAPVRRAGIPEWQGEPLGGKSIIVWGDQGIGDEVQFGRFLHDLRALAPRRITVGTFSQNVRLFAQFPVDLVVNRMEKTVVPTADYWVSLLSLAGRLGFDTPASIDARPYLQPRPRDGSGIGVVWRGNPRHSNDANRSLPSPAPLLDLPGATLLEPAGDTIDSLRTLAGLRALVTVDTSWAHLAGAIGLPCYVLLPFINQDWRWGLTAETSYWYASLQLLRQPSAGDWESPIRAARQALSKTG